MAGHPPNVAGHQMDLTYAGAVHLPAPTRLDALLLGAGNVVHGL